MKSSGADPVRRLVLDTSAYSQMRAGHELVLDMIARAEVVLLPVTTLGELEAGFQVGSRLQENRVALDEFLAEQFVTILPTTPAVARRYGEIFARLKKAGTPVPVNDIWIAAAAVDCAGHLLTFDEHFDKIEDLDCTRLQS